MSDGTSDEREFWWCTVHERVEDDSTTCRLADRYGPYESAEAAHNWRQRFQQREDEWEAQDREWDGVADDPGSED